MLGRMRTVLLVGTSLASLVAAGLAYAEVLQPDGTPMPQPVPAAETSVITSRGYPIDALDLATLFAARGESLDPAADPVVAPGTFVPNCEQAGSASLGAEVVLHGGGCRNAVGWYNATGEMPIQIVTLVPETYMTDMACYYSDMCPLATPTNSFGAPPWTPTTYTVSICDHAAYAGGAIGFVLMAQPATSSYCTMSKYTEPALNVLCSGCANQEPWVTTLVYSSTVTPGGHYVAFEDLPMTPESWQGDELATYQPEGDFNDLVLFVTGVCHAEDGEPCEIEAPPAGTGGSPAQGGSDPGTGGTSGEPTGGTSSEPTGGTSSEPTGGGEPEPGGATSANGGSETGGDPEPGAGGTSSSSGGSAPASEGGTPADPEAGSPGAIGGEGSEPTGGDDATDPFDVCEPGRTEMCTCSNGLVGAQQCYGNGSGWGECECVKPEGEGGCRYDGRDHDPRWLGGAALFLLAAARRRRRAPTARPSPRT